MGTITTRRRGRRTRRPAAAFRPAVEACEGRRLLNAPGTTASYSLVGLGAGDNNILVSLDGQFFGVFAGQLKLSLNGSSVPTNSYCVDLVDHISSGPTYAVTAQPSGALPNGGRLAYILNHFGATTATDPDQAAGVQLAIWEVEYDTGDNLSSGRFVVDSAPQAALDDAAAVLRASAGQSDSASYLQPTVAGAGQGMIVPGVCFTQGFWKNHPDAWPVNSLTLGGQTYTKAELITILETPPSHGNAALILAHQLIAAELNVINGCIPSAQVVQAIADADAALASIPRLGTSGAFVAAGSPLGQRLVADANILDAFNSSGM